MKTPFLKRSGQGFTLIEMLVVIAIIGILAGILLPVLAKVKENAQKRVAKMEIANLIGAINHYQEEYSRPPATKDIWNCSDQNKLVTFDFTFGGTISGLNIKTFGSPNYEANNSELMGLLLSSKMMPNAFGQLSTNFNPHQTTFFQPKCVDNNSSPGLGKDGVFRDPWGNPYIITLDLNEDNLCDDGFYAPIRKDRENLVAGIRGPAIAWSFGPDKKADPNVKSKEGANYDNVTSWGD